MKGFRTFLMFIATTAAGVFGFQGTHIVNVGVTAPFNKKFDPLQLSDNVPSIEVARLREAELKHGRWAMISALAIPLLETHSSEPAIHAYDKLPLDTQLAIAGGILMGEFATMLKGYETHLWMVRPLLSSFAKVINRAIWVFPSIAFSVSPPLLICPTRNSITVALP